MSDQLNLFINDDEVLNQTLATSSKAIKQLFDVDQHNELAQKLPMAFVLAKDVALCIENPDEQQLAFYSLILLADALSQGHVCVDLSTVANQQALLQWDIFYQFPDLTAYKSWLLQQSFVAVSESSAENAGTHEWQKPLAEQELCVLFDDYFYLTKWADLEQRLCAQLAQRARLTSEFDRTFLSQFTHENDSEETINWQDIAVVNSLLSPLSFVVGGPGTGKTTTVAQILQGILSAEGHEDYRIALAAPTGKAAARMASSLAEKVSTLPLCDELKDLLPASAQTLHRLLAWSSSQRKFTFNASNKLLLDCLIVDEVSMIDMAMFTALLEALPDHCRLILLGDPYQLASVAAGSVLAEICDPQRLLTFSSKRSQQLAFISENITASSDKTLMDNIVCLQKSYRFSATAGIGLLASACLQADESALALALLEPEISFFEKSEDQQADKALAQRLYQHYDQLHGCQSIEHAFSILAKFQLLCAIKEGDYSSSFYNQLMLEYAQSQQHLIQHHGDMNLYHGMPIMMEKNHHHLSLYNGDMGIVWLKNNINTLHSLTSDDLQASAPEQMVLHFALADGTVAEFLPSQIQGWCPAHAITVHKSQGSEYDEVAFASPAIDSPLLNREMLYTAITRSKAHFYCLAKKAELFKAIQVACTRRSALQKRLLESDKL